MTDTFRPAIAANDNIDLDAPLRLEDAVRLFFPYGGMTVSGLRREAQRGRLIIEKIANKHFTTRRAIESMRDLCRAKPSQHDFGYVRQAMTANACGSSFTVAGKSALAAARMTTAALKNPSKNI